MLSLFPDEKIVSQSSDNSVTLTSHRICYEYKSFSQSYNQSIMLEHITSCENYSSSSIVALILSCVALVLTVSAGYGRQSDLVILLFTLCVASAIYYWLSRKNFIVISSPSTRMMIRTKGMRSDLVLSFINKVEQTKHSRLVKLNQSA